MRKILKGVDATAVVRGEEGEAHSRAGADLSQRQGRWVNHEPLLVRKSRFNLLDSGLDFCQVSLQVEKSLTGAVLEDRLGGRRFVAFATHFWRMRNGAGFDAIREMNVRHVLVRVAAIRLKWGACLSRVAAIRLKWGPACRWWRRFG